MLLETVCQNFNKARGTNQTSTSYVSKVPTNTEPAADGGSSATASAAINVGRGYTQNSCFFVVYGTGADNNTCNVRLIGWRTIGSNVETLLWVPVILCDLACTLSAAVGVAGKAVVATERFADTIAVTTGSLGTSLDVVSPTGDVIAHAVADIKGFSKIEFSFNTNSSATDVNALYCLY